MEFCLSILLLLFLNFPAHGLPSGSTSTPPAESEKVWPPGSIKVNKDSVVIRIIPRPRLGNVSTIVHSSPWTEYGTGSSGEYYQCSDELIQSNSKELDQSIEKAISRRLFSHESEITSFDYECFNEAQQSSWLIFLGVVIGVISVIAIAVKKLKTHWDKFKGLIGFVNNKTGDSSIIDWIEAKYDDAKDDSKETDFYADETPKEVEQSATKDPIVTRKSKFKSWF